MSTIFDFTNPNWKYKGVLSAEMDKRAVEEFHNLPPQLLTVDPKFIVEIIGFIWIDEHDEWTMKMRLKFPSGNKQAFGKSFGKKANETIVLQEMYKLPMVNKHWFRNPEGTFESLLKVMAANDLIASMEIKHDGENIFNYRT